MNPEESHNPGLPANVSATRATAGTRREIFLVAVFIAFTSFSFFLIQYDHMRVLGEGHEAWMHGVIAGVSPAPIQYRVALPLVLDILERHAGLKVNQSLPFIEFLAYALALALLYLLFRSSRRVEDAPPVQRIALLGFFLAATQLPILWIFPWDRPETLPVAFFLAAIVLLVVRPSRIPFGLVCLLTLLLSLWQALVRSDVPVIAGIAILLCAVISIPFPRPRIQIATLGALCAAVAGAVQIYLQHIVYPTTTYPADTPKFQLLINLSLNPPLHIPTFLTALLPLIVTVVLLVRYRLSLESSDKLVLLMCLIYLPAWLVTGIIVEVRIFVPFLFLAAPTIAKLWTAYLLPEAGSPAPSR